MVSCSREVEEKDFTAQLSYQDIKLIVMKCTWYGYYLGGNSKDFNYPSLKGLAYVDKWIDLVRVETQFYVASCNNLLKNKKRQKHCESPKDGKICLKY